MDTSHHVKIRLLKYHSESQFPNPYHILTSKVLSWTKVVFVKHRIFNTLSLQQDMLFAETKNFSKLSGIWLSSRLSVDLVSNSLFLVSVLPRPKSLSASSVLLTTCPASSSNPSSSEASSQNIRDAGQWYWQVQQSHLPHHVFLFSHDLLDYLPQHIGRNSWGPRLFRIKTLIPFCCLPFNFQNQTRLECLKLTTLLRPRRVSGSKNHENCSM